MNLKNNNGFTLVELIVVIAILAILAAVAVPAYSGYIEKANETADLALIESVETGLNAAYALEGLATVGAEFTIAGGEAIIEFDNGDVAENFADFVDGTYTAATGSAKAKVKVDGFKNNGVTYTYVDGAISKKS